MEINIKLKPYDDNRQVYVYLNVDETTPENHIDIIMDDHKSSISIEEIKLAIKKITAKLGWVWLNGSASKNIYQR